MASLAIHRLVVFNKAEGVFQIRTLLGNIDKNVADKDRYDDKNDDQLFFFGEM